MSTTSLPSTRLRIILAICIACVVAGISYFYSMHFRPNAGDINMPLCMGEALLSGSEPYTTCQGWQSDGITPNTANPMTTVLVVMPLIPLPRIIAAALFIGISTGLLSYWLMREGYTRLLVLLAFPYWQAVQVVQWSPLLFAVALFPALLPLTLAKPHVGAAIALTRLSLWRIMACIAFLVLSLLVYPTWPLHMLNRIGAPADYQLPLLILPLGPLIGLVLLRWKQLDAIFLLLFALSPQRLFYDSFLLWLIPKTRIEILSLVALSWACYFAWYMWPEPGILWVIGLLYLPCVGMILRRKNLDTQATS